MIPGGASGETLLAGRVALVTGASRGVGRSIALGLGAAGANVLALGRSTADLEHVVSDIERAGGTATALPVDLRDAALVDGLAAQVAGQWGRLDVLVGNAGLLGDIEPLSGIAASVWNDVLAVNLTANWLLIRAFDRLLRNSDAGRGLFISAGVTRKASPGWGAYSVSKSALEMLVRTYATETCDTPVRVNLLNPGPMRKRMRTGETDEIREDAPPSEAIVPDVLRLVSPACALSGTLYDFPTRTTVAFGD